MTRDWRGVVAGFTPVMKLVHLAMRLETGDTKEIANELFLTKRKAYEDMLTQLAAQAGCPGRRGAADSNTLTEMKKQSKDDAESIINTYNYDLAHAIIEIHNGNPRANRHTYAKELRAWDKERSAWKSTQIVMNDMAMWQSRAQAEFVRFNDLKGRARLMPNTQADEKVCEQWINRGWLKLSDTATMKAIEGWPPHLNCPHFWVLEPNKIADCSEMWLGVEPRRAKELMQLEEDLELLLELM